MPDTNRTVRGFSADKTIEFYRQPGGCLEIWQTDPGEPANSNDVIHVCPGDEAAFIAELTAFDAEVHGKPELDPRAPKDVPDA